MLPYVTGGQAGLSGSLTEAAVISGLVLAGVVKWGLKHSWRRVPAPRGRHRSPLSLYGKVADAPGEKYAEELDI